VRAFLGEAKMKVRDLLSLAPGDIIQLDKLIHRDFIMQIEGRNKYAGRVGQLRSFRAMQITRRARPDELL
jgi:flagellar motor switch protein FliM